MKRFSIFLRYGWPAIAAWTFIIFWAGIKLVCAADVGWQGLLDVQYHDGYGEFSISEDSSPLPDGFKYGTLYLCDYNENPYSPPIIAQDSSLDGIWELPMQAGKIYLAYARVETLGNEIYQYDTTESLITPVFYGTECPDCVCPECLPRSNSGKLLPMSMDFYGAVSVCNSGNEAVSGVLKVGNNSIPVFVYPGPCQSIELNREYGLEGYNWQVTIEGEGLSVYTVSVPPTGLEGTIIQ